MNLGLRTWTGSEWSASIDLDASGYAQGAVNDGFSVTDPIAGITLDDKRFGEAAINLTDSGVFPADQCLHFGSAFVKSRSSDSFTSELKDLIAPIAVSIDNCPDVHVTKTVGDSGSNVATVNAGDTVVFTLVISNDGFGPAFDVSLTDILPAGIAWTEDSPFASITDGVLSASIDELSSGQSVTIHVTGIVPEDVCGTLRNEAIVSAANEDHGDEDDNIGRAIIIVNPVLTADDVQFLTGTNNALLADSLPAAASALETLNLEQLQPYLAQAMTEWRAAGPSSDALDRLRVRIVDLQGAMLGLAYQNVIWIDQNAAGWGWNFGGQTAGQMDLMTVLRHELGHVLGLEHGDADVMASTLPAVAPPSSLLQLSGTIERTAGVAELALPTTTVTNTEIVAARDGATLPAFTVTAAVDAAITAVAVTPSSMRQLALNYSAPEAMGTDGSSTVADAPGAAAVALALALGGPRAIAPVARGATPSSMPRLALDYSAPEATILSRQATFPDTGSTGTDRGSTGADAPGVLRIRMASDNEAAPTANTERWQQACDACFADTAWAGDSTQATPCIAAMALALASAGLRDRVTETESRKRPRLPITF